MEHETKTILVDCEAGREMGCNTFCCRLLVPLKFHEREQRTDGQPAEANAKIGCSPTELFSIPQRPALLLTRKAHTRLCEFPQSPCHLPQFSSYLCGD